MTVIALSGWKMSGKDTATDLMVREYGFTRLSFADALKEMVAAQYNIPLDYMHQPGKKEMPLAQYPVIPGDPFAEQIQKMLGRELISGFWTPRALCILEGSIKRSVYSNYWVRQVITGLDPGENYVISDMRYKSEADTLKLLLPDLVTIRIERFDSIDTQDPSERNLDDYRFDYTLQNRGTKEQFEIAISDLLGDLFGTERLRE